MTLKNKFLSAALILMSCISCKEASEPTSGSGTKDTLTNTPSTPMKSHVSIFEIPANDISRAIQFYQAILDIKIEYFEMPDMKMGVFPYEGHLVTGVILQSKGYKPSAEGVTIYLNGGENLQDILDKVEKNGGKILTPKTPHADGSGYFALFIDSEGNKMGLHSVK